METVSPARHGLPPPPDSPAVPKRRTGWIILGAFVVALLVGVGLVAKSLYDYGKPPPDFPSLVDQPDPDLTGTVAWVDISRQCVRVMDIGGGPSRDVYCFGPGKTYDLDWTTLVWLPDGRLEITTHSWPPDEDIRVDSQRIVDVATGDVDEVPSADLPEPRTPDLDTGPTERSDGAMLSVENDGAHASLVLTDEDGSRTLLEASGNTEYGFQDPVWGPDGSWALVDDGRLLLVTVDDTPTTRILLENGAHGFSAGARGWAVTGEELPADG